MTDKSDNEFIILEQLYQNLEHLVEALCQIGFFSYPKLQEVIRKLVAELIDGVVRQPTLAAGLLRDRKLPFYLPYHSVNSAIYAISAAIAMNFKGADLTLIGQGALLHDAGMSEVPRKIFEKNDVLDVEETFFIQKHPSRGAELLAGQPEPLVNIIRSHHERYRGGGYPRGTSLRFCGDVLSAIVSLADAYDATVSWRAYKEPLEPAEAKLRLRGESGESWSEPVIDGFMRGLARLGV